MDLWEGNCKFPINNFLQILGIDETRCEWRTLLCRCSPCVEGTSSIRLDSIATLCSSGFSYLEIRYTREMESLYRLYITMHSNDFFIYMSLNCLRKRMGGILFTFESPASGINAWNPVEIPWINTLQWVKMFYDPIMPQSPFPTPNLPTYFSLQLVYLSLCLSITK